MLSQAKNIIELFKKGNVLLALFLLILIVAPIFFSGNLIWLLTDNYFFFQNLHPLDISLIYLIFSVTIAFSLTPSSFIALFGGYLFGYVSLVYCIPALIVAQSIGYFVSKLLDSASTLQWLKSIPSIDNYLTKIDRKQREFIVIIRLTPIVPFAISNILLQVLGVNFKNFTSYGLLGMLPRTLIFAIIGHSISDIQHINQLTIEKITISIILTMVSLVGFYVLIKSKK
ncbi:MAG: VTT domain-containing protein [Bacteroidota bacterium]|nr:VTT domain-containing protein [Bacteroidota bacterium]